MAKIGRKNSFLRETNLFVWLQATHAVQMHRKAFSEALKGKLFEQVDLAVRYESSY
jgi:hypothetical protein